MLNGLEETIVTLGTVDAAALVVMDVLEGEPKGAAVGVDALALGLQSLEVTGEDLVGVVAETVNGVHGSELVTPLDAVKAGGGGGGREEGEDSGELHFELERRYCWMRELVVVVVVIVWELMMIETVQMARLKPLFIPDGFCEIVGIETQNGILHYLARWAIVDWLILHLIHSFSGMS